jgi:hypothetical protein
LRKVAALVDGFLLFTVADVWRMVWPLGLTFIVFITEIFYRWNRYTAYEGLTDVLCALAFCLTFSLLIISAIVGLLVPFLLGHSLPEPHIAIGPWGYEEMFGYAVGVVCLWRTRLRNVYHTNSRLTWMGCAVAVFSGVGILWVGRWDVMAHVGNVPRGWFMLELSSLDWTRLFPKVLHLFFSSLTAGGCLVTLLGLTVWFRGNRAAASLLQSHASTIHIRYGVGWMLSGLIPQILIGPWLLMVVGETPLGNLIDGVGFISIIFFVSVTVALVALVLLNASFMVPHVTGLVWGGILCVLVSLVLMGIIRHAVFLDTLQAKGIPIAMGSVTTIHFGAAMIFTGLLGAILFLCCSVSLYPTFQAIAQHKD